MSGRRADQATRSNGVHQSSNNGSIRTTNTTPSPISSTSIRYMECQRNQAVVVGGYAVDGCREFMATGQEGTAEALTCAACACHQSFHRRVEIYHVADQHPPAAAANSQQNGY